jgi:hypothetical protein
VRPRAAPSAPAEDREQSDATDAAKPTRASREANSSAARCLGRTSSPSGRDVDDHPGGVEEERRRQAGHTGDAMAWLGSDEPCNLVPGFEPRSDAPLWLAPC